MDTAAAITLPANPVYPVEAAEEVRPSPVAVVTAAEEVRPKITLTSALDLKVEAMAGNPDLVAVAEALLKAIGGKSLKKFDRAGAKKFKHAEKTLKKELPEGDSAKLASAFVGTQIELLAHDLSPDNISDVVTHMATKVKEDGTQFKKSSKAKKHYEKLSSEVKATVEEFKAGDDVEADPTEFFSVFDAAEPLADIIKPAGDWGLIGNATDLLSVIGVASSLRQVIEARAMARIGGALIVQAQGMRAAGENAAAEVVEKQGHKMVRIAAGMAVTGSVDIASGLLGTAGGVTLLADATQLVAGAALGGASAILGGVIGLMEIGMSGRNLHNARIKKGRLRDLQDKVIKGYAKVPGTETEVELMYDLVKAKKHKLNMKMISGSFGIASGSVATAAAVTAAVASLAVGAATAGIGVVALAAIGAGVALGQMVTKKVVAKRWEHYQKALSSLGEKQRTPAHTYGALFVQIKSEQLMLERREEAREEMGDLAYEFDTNAVAIGDDGVGEAATPREAIFMKKVCPLVFGMSAEAFVATVELTLDYLRGRVSKDRPQIIEDLKTREKGDKVEEEVDFGDADINLILKYKAETDPVWKARLLNQIKTGAVGEHYRPGGRKEFKKFTECDEKIVRMAGKIKELYTKLDTLEKKKQGIIVKAQRKNTLNKIRRSMKKFEDLKADMQEAIEEDKEKIQRLKSVLNTAPTERKKGLSNDIVSLEQEVRGHRRLLREHGKLKMRALQEDPPEEVKE